MTDFGLRYLVHTETKRSNLAQEMETQRHNKAVEYETNRSNVAKEFETNRHNTTDEKETKRHNVQGEFENRVKDAYDEWLKYSEKYAKTMLDGLNLNVSVESKLMDILGNYMTKRSSGSVIDVGWGNIPARGKFNVDDFTAKFRNERIYQDLQNQGYDVGVLIDTISNKMERLYGKDAYLKFMRQRGLRFDSDGNLIVPD